jgi:hypothetical protein
LSTIGRLRIPERQQFLAEHVHPKRCAVGLRQLAREGDRQPVAAEILADERAGAGRLSSSLSAAENIHPILTIA